MALHAAVAALSLAASASAETSTDCAARLAIDPPRAVTRIIDGETLLLDDGSEIRLEGALTPRRPMSSAPPAAWAPEAEAAAELARQVLGASVVVARAARSDRYGRSSGQVFAVRDSGRLWVQREMIERGHARAHSLPGRSTPCLGELLAAEERARAASLGLWSNAAYAVRRALRTRELMRLRSTYQVVEGRVASTADLRGTFYVNFGADWRTDFTAALVRRGGGRHKATGGLPQSLDGRRVRVRGWIERRNGPFIRLQDAAEIEVLD